MATVLDTTLVSFLMPIFVFLFIFVVLYALLSKTKLFGEKQVTLNLLAAICVAAVATFAGNLVKLVGSITPWIVFILIVLTLIFGLYSFFGLKEKDIWGYIGGPTLIFVIILIIVMVGLTTVFEPQISPYTDAQGNVITNGTGGQNVRGAVITTLTHPRLLGAIFLLVIAALSVKVLIDKTE